MLFTKDSIKQFNKTITKDLIVLGIIWTLFFTIFLITGLNIKKLDVNLIKFINGLLGSISSIITIYIVLESLSKAVRMKNVYKSIMTYEENTFIGEIIKYDVIRTVNKGITAREIEIKISDDLTRIFYLDQSFDINSFTEHKNVVIKARNNYVMEIEKYEEIN